MNAVESRGLFFLDTNIFVYSFEPRHVASDDPHPAYFQVNATLTVRVQPPVMPLHPLA